MAWLQRNGPFALWLVACAAVATTGWWEGWTWRGRHRRAEARLVGVLGERAQLAAEVPAPTEENGRVLAATLAQAEARAAELRAIWRAPEGEAFAEAAPARPMEAYFALAAMDERIRAAAVRAQVALRPEEHFGFASHAHEGPAGEILPVVHRQRQVIEHLLLKLLEARPQAVLGVQREQPREILRRRAAVGTGAVPLTEESGRAAEVATDFFVPEPAGSARLGGLVEGESYRVEFTGQTQTLRTWLNALADGRAPLTVRGVEVEAGPPPAPAAGAGGAGVEPAAAPVPVVTNNISKFAVVVETVEVLAGPRPAQP